MWKFNPFTPREPSTLEGRYVDVGNIKVYVRNVIAEGGFSSVYLARDAVNTSKQYALKHIICNDGESLELVVKEVSVMKMLRGHPNVVTLIAHTILDMGRTKEALLVMEFCDKSLVTVLEKRGAVYFKEKEILSIFRDVCNAVFAMHSQVPPVAHRDLKAENVLLGSDGVWKLCDFGSTSTKHKCFDKPEERGVEEDIIRKHTTPAYRAPEMWDLYRKEVISEKADIWALGCILYRICYLKSAFDGESKLQILNGNYHIPEVPNYSSSITGLIKDMLEASPDARPDITQARALLDWPFISMNLGVVKKTNLIPQRNPPPISSREQAQNISSQSQGRQKAGGTGGSSMGAFWNSHHAQDKDTSSSNNKESTHIDFLKMPDSSNPSHVQQLVNKTTCQNESSNTFAANFDTSKLNVRSANANISGRGQEAEVNNLKEQLKQANLDKAEITSKYEKLTAICRSQRQEIQELKQALAAATPSPQSNKDSSKSQISPGTLQVIDPKMDGGILELEQAMFASSSILPCASPQPWQAFPDEQKAQTPSYGNQSGMVWPTNGHQNIIRQSASSPNISRALGMDNDLLFPSPSFNMARMSNQGSASQMFGSPDTANVGTGQPPGWAGF